MSIVTDVLGFMYFELIIALVLTNDPVVVVNVCTKFHAVVEISLTSTNINWLVVLEENSGDHQSHQDTSPENQECLCEI